MRELSIGVGCVIGLWLLISMVSTFNTAAQQPAGAMEIAQLRADTAAAQAETKNAIAQVERLKVELKKAAETNQKLQKRIADLENKTKHP